MIFPRNLVNWCVRWSASAIVFLGVGLGGAWGDLVITEFMAVNGGVARDEDGDSPDWVEIFNAGPGAVDLGGYSLTDDALDLSKWVFPSVVLGAGEFLVVWASDKNRRDAEGELHANFKLSGGGEYLGLVEPDGGDGGGRVRAELPGAVCEYFVWAGSGRDVVGAGGRGGGVPVEGAVQRE